MGTVNVLEASSAGGDVKASAGLHRIKIEGGGEVADGRFGGWLRFDGTGNQVYGLTAGYAWWKPIDQFKLGIGGNPDGIWGAEGNASWMFYQTISDTGVVQAGNAWGGGYGGLFMRKSVFGGFSDNRLFLEITPVDMVSINIAIPFFQHYNDIGQIFMGSVAQVALNMSFGNIALTYVGDQGKFSDSWSPDRDPNIKNSQIFGFFSLTAIDNLQLDFGIGADFTDSDGINLGIAVKYGRDTWGIKFRTLVGVPVRGSQHFGMLFDILPYFVINESFRAYISAGMNIANIDDLANGAGWHVNPYIEVGEEWGPKFGAGIQVWSKGGFSGSPLVEFALPIALIVSF